MIEKKLNVTISAKELYNSTDSRAVEALKCMCELLAFDAALQQELATINELAESCETEKQKLSDERLQDFSVTLTFKDKSLDLALCSMDTYDAFCNLLLTALNEIDMNR